MHHEKLFDSLTAGALDIQGGFFHCHLEYTLRVKRNKTPFIKFHLVQKKIATPNGSLFQCQDLSFFSVLFLGPPSHSIQVQVICWLILGIVGSFRVEPPPPKSFWWFRRWVSGWCSNDSRRMFRLSLGHVFSAILGQKRNSMVWTQRSSYHTSGRFLSIHTSNNRSGLKAKSVNFSELGWDCEVKAKGKNNKSRCHWWL